VYTLSKQTVASENQEQPTYFKMHFAEFLEMLARTADLKFLGTPQETLFSITDKLEWVFNTLFPLVKATVFRLDIGNLEETESDKEY
jgi:hypothetical protein